jgi:hypothetical protein
MRKINQRAQQMRKTSRLPLEHTSSLFFLGLLRLKEATGAYRRGHSRRGQLQADNEGQLV